MRGFQARGVGRECIPGRHLAAQGAAFLWPGPPAPEPEEPQAFDFALLQSEGRSTNRLSREAVWDNYIQFNSETLTVGKVPHLGTGKGEASPFRLGFSPGFGRGIHFQGVVRNTKCIVVQLHTSHLFLIKEAAE